MPYYYLFRNRETDKRDAGDMEGQEEVEKEEKKEKENEMK